MDRIFKTVIFSYFIHTPQASFICLALNYCQLEEALKMVENGLQLPGVRLMESGGGKLDRFSGQSVPLSDRLSLFLLAASIRNKVMLDIC